MHERHTAAILGERFLVTVDLNDTVLYTVRDVASRLGVHPETVRRLIHDGRLDAVRVGRVLRVDSTSFHGFLVNQRVKPASLRSLSS
jgi:excisionase family DNA binding protein